MSVIWNAIRKFFIKKLIQFRWNPRQVTMLFLFPVNPHRGLDGFSTDSIVCPALDLATCEGP